MWLVLFLLAELQTVTTQPATTQPAATQPATALPVEVLPFRLSGLRRKGAAFTDAGHPRAVSVDVGQEIFDSGWRLAEVRLRSTPPRADHDLVVVVRMSDGKRVEIQWGVFRPPPPPPPPRRGQDA